MNADGFSADQRAAWLIRLGDDALVLGHRLSEWSSRAPTLEEDIALSNLALDLIGQARAWYQHACALEGGRRTEDDLAYRRDQHEFRNLLIVEQPNGDFADTMARHLLYAAFAEPFLRRLAATSNDPEVAGIAARSAKEMAYHVRHAGRWVVRLGDGTETSHGRMKTALEKVWPHAAEMMEADALDHAAATAGFGIDPGTVRDEFEETITAVLAEATIRRPMVPPGFGGGRRGYHGEHLGVMLAVMQSLARAHPGATW